jgi:hypothetical protein
MNEQEYQDKFRSFVLDKVRTHRINQGLPANPKDAGYAALGTEDSLVYFYNHFPRFWAMIKLCEENGVLPDKSCELGSFYPYTTLYFDGKIDLYDIAPLIFPNANPYEICNVRMEGLNLCTDQIPADRKYDLVILSEVMEHLPCNLYELCERVQSIVNSQGYLIATYPVQYRNNAEYYEQDLGDPGKSHDGHLREFTDETVDLFFTKIRRVAKIEVFYPAYGRIIIVMYQNA